MNIGRKISRQLIVHAPNSARRLGDATVPMFRFVLQVFGIAQVAVGSAIAVAVEYEYRFYRAAVGEWIVGIGV